MILSAVPTSVKPQPGTETGTQAETRAEAETLTETEAQTGAEAGAADTIPCRMLGVIDLVWVY